MAVFDGGRRAGDPRGLPFFESMAIGGVMGLSTRALLRLVLMVALGSLASVGWLSAAAQAATPVSKDEYRLGSGDAVRITVFQNPELSLEARVSESGVISYPLLGSVKLGGLSLTQAEKRIVDGLREGNFVKQPQVSILVVTVRGSQASILGQVNKPGRYPLEQADTKLSDLLALAGGIAPNGSDTAVVSGQRSGKAFRKEVDVPLVLAGKQSEDIGIQAGDVVFIDRMPMVYIYGEVQKPGAFRLERDMTLMQALAAGGGLTLRGTQKGLRVNRRGSDGKVEALTPGMQDTLRDGDVVYVRESLF